MADKKVTALTALTAASNNDILMIVDDPLGTPISKKITVEDVFGNTTKTTLNKIHIGSSNTNITGTTLTLYPGTGGQSSNVSVQGSLSIANTGVLRINSSTTPSTNNTSTTTGTWTVGQIGWDANYIYVVTAAGAGGIKRVALSTF
jgi:hypothetical protein